MEEYTKINSLEELKALWSGEHEGESGEFFIQLGLGRSWKVISYEGDGYWWVLNEIDESEQELSDEQLFDEEYTNIGKAINAGSFYFGWF